LLRERVTGWSANETLEAIALLHAATHVEREKTTVFLVDINYFYQALTLN
jgi:hypothetical protein